MIRTIRIQNYKSILDHTIELGRFNIFIGENGCGKTNFLEAIAMASAAVAGKLDAEELYSKGVRIAKPSTTFSSFTGKKQKQRIELSFGLEGVEPEGMRAKCSIESRDPDDITAAWVDKESNDAYAHKDIGELTESMRTLVKQAHQLLKESASASTTIVSDVEERLMPALQAMKDSAARQLLAHEISDFVIYNLNVLALRGLQVTSRKEPLGINGENLDVLISSFRKKELDEMMKRSKLVSWLDTFFVDPKDVLKFEGHKLGRSISTLYFRDKFMRQKGNVFSAENANEGILHVLFYLALFISAKTPKFFGIDNIETALNPRLCRKLITEIVELASQHGKQVLLTTHNPATLDGLNLHDDDQRLFVVYRNNEGHTVTKRIKLKPETGQSGMPLSELWMRGHLGGIPKQF